MISRIAEFYVNIIEPALHIFAVVALVMAVLYVVNLLRGGKDDIITRTVNGFFKLIYKLVVLLGVLVARLLKAFVRQLHLIFAVIRDFFTSKDL